VLPCPTLSVVIGLSLMFGMHRSMPWSAALAVVGITYGVIGVFGSALRSTTDCSPAQRCWLERQRADE
jgi:type IV secretory pathway VirB2 component (pilin)